MFVQTLSNCKIKNCNYFIFIIKIIVIINFNPRFIKPNVKKIEIYMTNIYFHFFSIWLPIKIKHTRVLRFFIKQQYFPEKKSRIFL